MRLIRIRVGPRRARVFWVTDYERGMMFGFVFD